MEQFNLIPSQGNWNDAASLLNTNFLRAYTQFLQLANSTMRFKGVYPTLTALKTAVPRPVQGDWAYVGSSFPMPIYIFNDSSWVVNGSGTGGESTSAIEAAKASAIKEIVAQAAMYLPIEEDGWHFTDKAGNEIVSITGSGLDAAVLTEHFKTLVKSISGIGLSLGETSSTAYPGDKGAENAREILQLSNSLLSLIETLSALAVNENGFFITDSAGNTMMQVTSGGFEAAAITDKFKKVLEDAGISGDVKYEVVSEVDY